MNFIALLIGAGSLVAGVFILILSFAMLIVYPILGLVVTPMWLLLIWWVRRRFFRRRRPFTAYHLITGTPAPQDHPHHLVEPITIGGHVRHSHHGEVDGEWR